MAYSKKDDLLKAKAAEIKREEKKTKEKKELSTLLPESEIELLKGRGIEIAKQKNKTITYNDVKNIKIDPVYTTRKTTITVNYIIEKIPVPSVNNIINLTSDSNIFNKPKPFLNEETGITTFATGEDNYINSSGKLIELKVIGDEDTNYIIVVKDVTSGEYYNWDTTTFEDGYNEKLGKHILLNKETPKLAQYETLILDIPSRALETTYNIYFKSGGSANYSTGLPTETDPWIIKQLVKPVTTFKFSDSNGFISQQSSTKTHLPGYILNSGSINDGKIPITITTIAMRGTISLVDSEVLNENIGVGDSNTVVIDSDLTASVDSTSKIGTITGTITLGKSATRDTNVLFSPNSNFTIT